MTGFKSRFAAVGMAALIGSFVGSGLTSASPLQGSQVVVSTPDDPSQVAIEGRMIQGGWAMIHLPPYSQLEWGQRQWQADSQGRALIGFSRDQASPVKVRVTLPNQASFDVAIDLTAKDYLIQRIDGLPQRFVTPDPEALKRIRQDAALARAAREKMLDRTDFLTDFIWPTEGIVTGVWGSQRILNGEPRRPHFGIDIANETGTPILAPAAGKVTLVANMELSGGTVFVDHGYGLRSDFLHLEEILVELGDVVEQGQVIATMGATGRATGPHLHWGMSWMDIRVDPEEVFELPRRLQRGDQIIGNKAKFID
ncbi:M23 family metallopeptidase [Thiomicrospira sp. ALE5]|uniref:M23 family metallopeptidase n=1 Tax=Thiomicrospira sp. ALE5 TaxID=748650 RepID=UPI0008EA5162|nr:M23 family metallopeptidase [Thiomicrospira sp. ALE5]SFR50578.1 Murein DD-endopeptidase MepM and murein hydrolase activator NlpD, contain LysM domain [Thiomicrospira sp. ALE5]